MWVSSLRDLGCAVVLFPTLKRGANECCACGAGAGCLVWVRGFRRPKCRGSMGWIEFVLSHPSRKERGMDGAPSRVTASNPRED